LAKALLEVTGAVRINYEILGNSKAALHEHVFPKPDISKTGTIIPKKTSHGRQNL